MKAGSISSMIADTRSPLSDDQPQVQSSPNLHVEESNGAQGGTPVVLIHGFGASGRTWQGVQNHLKGPSLAVDLPGHGRSLGIVPHGSAGRAAKALTETLDSGGLKTVHLAGHSMGGAVAALVALRQPERVGSLTLLAPGGFGPEINHRLLRRYAEAAALDELEVIWEQFFGWNRPLPREDLEALVAERRRPGAVKALAEILDCLIDGERQGMLDRRALETAPFPTKVLWGTQDRVLPTRQAHRLPGTVAGHIFEGVGHMLHLEVPEAVAQLIDDNIAAGNARATA